MKDAGRGVYELPIGCLSWAAASPKTQALSWKSAARRSRSIFPHHRRRKALTGRGAQDQVTVWPYEV
ncbi:hypothetical protein [Streptomyces sp. NPDC005209]|uniref:hypothetical protein n=1 Tax=Streptomyces sp. NPDC005209 TaxID=3156715 RepID=UPI0033A50D19